MEPSEKASLGKSGAFERRSSRIIPTSNATAMRKRPALVSGRETTLAVDMTAMARQISTTRPPGMARTGPPFAARARGSARAATTASKAARTVTA